MDKLDYVSRGAGSCGQAIWIPNNKAIVDSFRRKGFNPLNSVLLIEYYTASMYEEIKHFEIIETKPFQPMLVWNFTHDSSINLTHYD